MSSAEGEAGVKWAAGTNLGGNWELNVIREAGERKWPFNVWRKTLGCVSPPSHTLESHTSDTESQLCFVLLPIPHLVQRGKRLNLVPGYPLVFVFFFWGGGFNKEKG